MDVYLDTEFIDTGRTVEPISLGFVPERGESLYRIVDNPTIINGAVYDSWHRENTVPSLPITVLDPANWEWDPDHPDYTNVSMIRNIRHSVTEFFRDITRTGEPVTLWAWWAPYDFVVYCQLFGRMLDIPEGLPMHICDLRQEHLRLGEPNLPRQKSGKHNALADARHNMLIHETLKEVERSRFSRAERPSYDCGCEG